MDKEKSPTVHSGGLPPQSPSARSSTLSHDINRMLDNPPKKIGHRRAHSEILTLPNDLTFDNDLGMVGSGDGASFSDDTEEDLMSMYLDMDKVNSELSANPQNKLSSFGERPRVRHQHSLSMDSSMNIIDSEMLMSGNEDDDAKKSISDAKLSELALNDPKRAKRVWANRQSAARSKERKTRHIFELERKVQTLQTEATTVSANLIVLQRDSNELIARNNELKWHLQTMAQKAHLQNELIEALKEEILQKRAYIRQLASNDALAMNYGQFGSNQQFYSNNQSAEQLQQQQFQFQQQQLRHRLEQQETTTTEWSWGDEKSEAVSRPE